MKNFKHTGELLHKKRLEANFTQKDVATILGVGAQLISNIERHIQSIPAERQRKVSQILRISKQELFHAKKLDFVESFEHEFNKEWDQVKKPRLPKKPKKSMGRPKKKGR